MLFVTLLSSLCWLVKRSQAYDCVQKEMNKDFNFYERYKCLSTANNCVFIIVLDSYEVSFPDKIPQNYTITWLYSYYLIIETDVHLHWTERFMQLPCRIKITWQTTTNYALEVLNLNWNTGHLIYCECEANWLYCILNRMSLR